MGLGRDVDKGKGKVLPRPDYGSDYPSLGADSFEQWNRVLPHSFEIPI
jgi:hypothetical protein